MKAKVLLIGLYLFLAAGCAEEKESTEDVNKETVQKKSVETAQTPNPGNASTPKSNPGGEPAPQPQPSNPPAPQPKPAVRTGKLGDTATALTGLEWIKGDPVTITPEKVYVVEFWATWCGPCRTSIPHLTEVQRKYKDKGVRIVGVTKEAREKVEPFVTKMGEKMEYAVALDPQQKVNRGYMKAFNYGGIPHAFIVDQQGKIVWHGHPMRDMETVLDEVLAGTFDMEAYARERAEAQARSRRVRENLKAYFEKAKGGQSAEARALGEQLLEEASAQQLNAMAWTILTEVEKEQRDLALTLQAAEKANTKTENKEPAILDTYALALFENGEAAKAVEYQKKAVALSTGNEQMQADLQKRLEMFEKALTESK